jgi:hypothetical protein
VTQHIPDKGEQLIRYYGYYSNKNRGMRAQANPPLLAVKGAEGEAAGPTGKEARGRWAALIKRVYEVDPLVCKKCGGTMKIISFVEAHQTDVIEKILKHCGLWKERRGRDPPKREAPVPEAEPGEEGRASEREQWPMEEEQEFAVDAENPGWETSWDDYAQ